MGEQARSYFLSFPETVEDFPFSPDTPVFKIKNKMFGFLRYKGGKEINLFRSTNKDFNREILRENKQ